MISPFFLSLLSHLSASKLIYFLAKHIELNLLNEYMTQFPQRFKNLAMYNCQRKFIVTGIWILQKAKCFSSVQSLSHVPLSVTPWTAACQASLFIANSRSWLKLMFIESVMPSSNYLILCCPLLFPPSIFPSIRVFSNESILCITWPKFWGFSFSISLPLFVNLSQMFPIL